MPGSEIKTDADLVRHVACNLNRLVSVVSIAEKDAIEFRPEVQKLIDTLVAELDQLSGEIDDIIAQTLGKRRAA